MKMEQIKIEFTDSDGVVFTMELGKDALTWMEIVARTLTFLNGCGYVIKPGQKFTYDGHEVHRG